MRGSIAYMHTQFHALYLTTAWKGCSPFCLLLGYGFDVAYQKLQNICMGDVVL